MALTLQTDICHKLGIRYPIFQAGMAGKITNAKLVAAVSNAGGLGILGAAYMSPAQIDQTITEIKQLTDNPFGVNLFWFAPSMNKGHVLEMHQFLNRYRKQLDIAQHTNDVNYKCNQEEQLEVLLKHNVPVLSFTFGFPEPVLMARIKELDLKTIMMVTNVKEALIAQEGQIDILIAQGSEAGGHRGTLKVADGGQGSLVGTMALVPQIADHSSLPVMAAGGIMDGRGLVAALALGAQGIQLGTRFLLALEADTHPIYQEQLLNSTEDDTIITSIFSGRPARAINNFFIREAQSAQIEPLPYPWQNEITQDLRQGAAKANDPRFMSLWSGQGIRLAKEGQSTEAIIQEIIREAQRIID